MVTGVCSSLISISGKSSAEMVAKSAWKLFELTVNFPLAREKLTFSPSGKDLHSSDIFLADTVVSPSS